MILAGPANFASAALGLLAGSPPSVGQDIVSWASENRLALTFQNELLFFSIALLIPGVLALRRALARSASGVAACGILLAMAPVLLGLCIVHGRLVFPVFGIGLSPAAAELIVPIFYGGTHAVSEMLVVASVLFGLAMRHSDFGPWMARASFVSAVLIFLGAFQWITGPGPVFLSALWSSGMLVAFGWRLLRLRSTAADLGQPRSLERRQAKA